MPIKIAVDGYVYVPYNLNDLLAQPDDTVELSFNSKGGDLLDAITFHNKLRKCGKKIKGTIESFAISSAAVIAMACDELEMAENSLLMFHLPSYAPNYGETLEAEDLDEVASVLRKSEQILCTTISSKTGQTPEECGKMLKETTWFTPEEALKAKIVDRIVPIRQKNITVENSFPLRIVAFLQEKNNMPLSDVCKQFGIADTEEALTGFINALKAKAESQQQPKTIEVAPVVLNALRDARTNQLNALVHDGRIIPAIVNELTTTFLSDDRLKADIIGNDETFTKVVNAIGKNERIINFGGQSGTQKTAGENKSGTSVLIDDMKARAGK